MIDNNFDNGHMKISSTAALSQLDAPTLLSFATKQLVNFLFANLAYITKCL